VSNKDKNPNAGIGDHNKNNDRNPNATIKSGKNNGTDYTTDVNVDRDKKNDKK